MLRAKFARQGAYLEVARLAGGLELRVLRELGHDLRLLLHDGVRGVRADRVLVADLTREVARAVGGVAGLVLWIEGRAGGV